MAGVAVVAAAVEPAAAAEPEPGCGLLPLDDIDCFIALLKWKIMFN